MLKSLLSRWINQTHALKRTILNHLISYPTPINFNYSYSFGSLVGIFFAIQLCTGIFLAMHYVPHTDYAFTSVVHIMTNVKNGYLMRYMHANGASMIFIFLYLHIGRGLYYRSYTTDRRYLWWSGLIIFVLMMATAFIGYVLPWGQMSFWGATVITSLVTAIPVIGESIAYWLWGGFSVSNATLVRFFSLHYLLPFIITAIIGVHLVLLHIVTSTNPLQSESESKVPFYPYFVINDMFALSVGLVFFIFLIHFYPNVLGHPDNFIPANPLVTPPHIVPEWYFTPFYAILRSCPNKLGGVIFMAAAILSLFFLPFAPTHHFKPQTSFSSTQKILFWAFIFNFGLLLFLGGKPAAQPYIFFSQIATFYYFWYVLIEAPLVPWLEAKGIEDWTKRIRFLKLQSRIKK
jgi:quinol-cytochrome oxidoreductase complex cytochrome b subunit